MAQSTIHIAAAMILDPNKKLLLVRKKGSTFYMLPGGKFEAGENVLQTLKRELREELNLQVQEANIEFLGTHETDAVNEPNTRVHGSLCRINLPHTQVFTPQAEIEEVVWVSRENYKNYKFAHLAEEFILPKWLQISAS